MLSLIVVLFVAAICLFLAEVIVPGWILAILGFLVTAIAIVLTFIQYGVSIGSLTLCVAVLVGISGFVLWMRFFPKSSLGERLINHSVAGGRAGTIQPHLTPGQEGVAETDLRPAGTGRFGNQRVDVVSEATFISKDEEICITQVAGSRIVVRAVSSFQG
ncbi:MAG TPA: NfeD family protein [Chthoniobacterales bacterium]|jgi:membrane-bound serine protease (ClpP class)